VQTDAASGWPLQAERARNPADQERWLKIAEQWPALGTGCSVLHRFFPELLLA
jgi:hypothetical protein